MGADLVLLVMDSDISAPELEALQTLLESGKPVLLVLNRSDRWPEQERRQLLRHHPAALPVDEPMHRGGGSAKQAPNPRRWARPQAGRRPGIGSVAAAPR